MNEVMCVATVCMHAPEHGFYVGHAHAAIFVVFPSTCRQYVVPFEGAVVYQQHQKSQVRSRCCLLHAA